MLAFDREALRALGRSVRSGVSDLDAIRCDDPLAQHVMALVERSREPLRTWLDRIRDLAADRLMETYTPVVPGAVDHLSFDAALLTAGLGWTVLTDPADTASGHLDRSAIASLVAQMDDGEVVELLEQLRAARVLVVQGTSTSWGSVDEIDAAVSAVAMALGPATSVSPGRAESIVEASHPEMAALLLVSVDAEAAVLARLAVSVLARWADLLSGRGDLGAWPLDSPATHVMSALAVSPDASRQFMALAIAHPHGLHLVTDTGADPTITTAMVLGATDPATCSIDEAGEIVPTYLRFVLEEMGTPGVKYDGGFRAGLGAICGPCCSR